MVMMPGVVLQKRFCCTVIELLGFVSASRMMTSGIIPQRCFCCPVSELLGRVSALYDGGAAHSSTYTQGCKALVNVSSLHLIKKCYKDSVAGASYRVAKGNGSTVYIKDVSAESKVMLYSH
jgi:hypothetical protein